MKIDKDKNLLKDLENITGMDLEPFKIGGLMDFFYDEIELYDERLFDYLINSLKINKLEKFSRNNFQDRLFSHGIINDNRYQLTLKGTAMVAKFLNNYSSKYEIKLLKE